MKKILHYIIIGVVFFSFAKVSFASNLPGYDIQILPQITTSGIVDGVTELLPFSLTSGANGFYACIVGDYTEIPLSSSDWTVGGNNIDNFTNADNYDYNNWWSCGTSTAGWVVLGANGGTGDYYYWGFWKDDTNLWLEPELPLTIGISALTPENDAIGVNALTNFTGTYDNDGTYTKIVINIENIDMPQSVPIAYDCKPALVGTGLNYSCNISLSTDTHYLYSVYLIDSSISTGVADSGNPYAFTTGFVYEVQTPPTSSTCSTFDVGCYLENAISWTFGLSQDTLNQFNNLTLRNSLPFSYIYDMGTLYEELFNDTPQDIDISIAFGAFGNITLMSTDKLNAIPFHGMVRTILGAIMIFMTAMFLYREILGVHDPITRMPTDYSHLNRID